MTQAASANTSSGGGGVTGRGNQGRGKGGRGRGGRGRGRGRGRGGRGDSKPKKSENGSAPSENGALLQEDILKLSLNENTNGKQASRTEGNQSGGSGGRSTGRGRGRSQGRGGRGDSKGKREKDEGSCIEKQSDRKQKAPSKSKKGTDDKVDSNTGGANSSFVKNQPNEKKSKQGSTKENKKSKSLKQKTNLDSDTQNTKTNLKPSIPPNQSQQTSDLNYGNGENISILHVGEKPSIAEAIAKGLCNGERSVMKKAMPVHTFTNPSFPKAPYAKKVTHKVTSVAGKNGVMAAQYDYNMHSEHI